MNTAARQRLKKQLRKPMQQRTRNHPLRRILLFDGLGCEVEAGRYSAIQEIGKG